MKSEKLVFLLLCFFSIARVSAQTNDYLFARLDVADGLSNNHITSIFKDAKGFMWFGTGSGLNRYDGYQFLTFRHDTRDPHSIADNYIEQIFAGPEGRIWVESRVGQFNIYDFATDRFDTDFRAYLRKRELPVAGLLNIKDGKSGSWFIYRDSGLFQWQPDGKIASLRPGPPGSGAIAQDPIASAGQDSRGDLWVVHQNGLIEKIDAHQHKVVYQTGMLKKEFGNEHISSGIYMDAQDGLWFFSSGVFKGVYYFNPSTGKLRHFAQDAGERNLTSNIVYSVLEDAKGKFWLATDHGGVDILDKQDFSVTSLGHDADDSKSISENSVTSLFKDDLAPSGWVPSKAGSTITTSQTVLSRYTGTSLIAGPVYPTTI